MTDFVRLTADQPPLWIAFMVAVGVICAVIVLVGGLVITTAGLMWLRSALDPDAVQVQSTRTLEQAARQQTHMCPPALRTIADREQIVATALNQVPRC